jgi:hypothetical protein
VTRLIGGYFGAWVALLFYFVPLVSCHVFYVVRTVRNWLDDRRRREASRGRHAQVVALWKWRDRQADEARNSETYEAWLAANPMPQVTGDVYYPTDTVGTVLGRMLVSWVPIVNLWVTVFEVIPQVFGKFFDWISSALSQPLVPDNDGKRGAK